METGQGLPTRQPMSATEADVAARPIEADPTIGMGGASPADLIDEMPESDPNKSDIIERAKQLGKTTVEAGTKWMHSVEDKYHESQQNRDPQAKSKSRYMAGAGAVAIASGMRMAAKRRQSRHPKQSGPQAMITKAKEMIPSR